MNENGTPVKMNKLEKRLNQICDEQPFTTRFYAKCLKIGAVFERDATTQQPSASTRKVAIMMAAYKAAHEGKLSFDEVFTVTSQMQRGVASGSYRYMTPGCQVSMLDAITNMIITSDNVCTQMIYSRLTLKAMNTFCQAVGMENTLHNQIFPPLELPPDHSTTDSNATTAADQGLLLELILRGSQDEAIAGTLGSTPTLCSRALDVLSWQLMRMMMPALLPFETRVGCKSGRGKRGRMDIGIGYHGAQPAYIMAAYTDDVPDLLPSGLPGFTGAFSTIAKLSRACWEATAPT